MNLKIKNFSKINGTVKAPSSKSYSHRAVILASLAEGKSKLFDVLYSEDVLSSIRACEALGAKIDRKKEIILKGIGNNSPFRDALKGIKVKLLTIWKFMELAVNYIILAKIHLKT